MQRSLKGKRAWDGFGSGKFFHLSLREGQGEGFAKISLMPSRITHHLSLILLNSDYFHVRIDLFLEHAFDRHQRPRQ